MNAIEYENYVNFFKSKARHGADWRSYAVPKWATDNGMRTLFTKRARSMYMVCETVLDEKVYVEKGKLKVLAKESDDGPELVRKVATVDDLVLEIGIYHNQYSSKHKFTLATQIEYVRGKEWYVPKYLGGLTAGVARLIDFS